MVITLLIITGWITPSSGPISGGPKAAGAPVQGHTAGRQVETAPGLGGGVTHSFSWFRRKNAFFQAHGVEVPQLLPLPAQSSRDSGAPTGVFHPTRCRQTRNWAQGDPRGTKVSRSG